MQDANQDTFNPLVDCDNKPVPLTAANLIPFMCWTMRYQDPDGQHKAAIDAAKGDETALDALFRFIDQYWMKDDGPTLVGLSVVKQLGDPAGETRLNDYIWQPLPPVGTGVDLTQREHAEGLDITAVDALWCIHDDRASSLLATIASSHPSNVVKQRAGDPTRAMHCLYDDLR